MYDVVIIGAGPAGISAGIYGASRGKKVLMIEKDQAGGLIGKVSTVTHYAGVAPGETGVAFAAKTETAGRGSWCGDSEGRDEKGTTDRR